MTEQEGFYPVDLIEEAKPGEDSTWLALHLDLPGCHATGATADEAQGRLDVAREAWLAVAADRGITIPPRRDAPLITVQYAIRRDRNAQSRRTAADVVETQEVTVPS